MPKTRTPVEVRIPSQTQEELALEDEVRKSMHYGSGGKSGKCRRGHALSGENLYVHGGIRYCRLCRQTYQRLWMRAHHAEVRKLLQEARARKERDRQKRQEAARQKQVVAEGRQKQVGCPKDPGRNSK
jgi:hypothetical protein